MKKSQFLIKIHKEHKLQIVEPSVEMEGAYLQRSNKSLSSAKALLKIGNLEDAVALAYYSMYHCLLALLYRVGIKCENHTASIILLKEVFGKDNKAIKEAKSERVDKQYYVDFNITKEETGSALEVAEEFISHLVDFIEKLNKESINSYRKKVKDLIYTKE